MEYFVSYREILFYSPVLKRIQFEFSEALFIGFLFETGAEVDLTGEVFLYAFNEEGVGLCLRRPDLSAVLKFGTDICCVCL